jgi:hypothetical protein
MAKFAVRDEVTLKSKVYGDVPVQVVTILGGAYFQYQVKMRDGRLAVVGEDDLTRGHEEVVSQ